MGRRIFIGDIQGCLAELEDLLEAVGLEPGVDEIHPVGDFVNRGPENLRVLRLMRELGAGGVLGNHDVHLLRTARGLRELADSDTIEDVLGAPDRDELLAWLAERPFALGWDDVLAIHAGVHPRWDDPVELLRDKEPWTRDPDVDFATRVRWCTADGRMPERDEPPPGPPFRPWYEFARERPWTIVFGHWSQRGLVRERGVCGLDTGCVWGGSLTAWVPEEERIEQIPARRAYQSPG